MICPLCRAEYDAARALPSLDTDPDGWFRACDVDGDGCLSKDQVRACVRTRGTPLTFPADPSSALPCLIPTRPHLLSAPPPTCLPSYTPSYTFPAQVQLVLLAQFPLDARPFESAFDGLWPQLALDAAGRISREAFFAPGGLLAIVREKLPGMTRANGGGGGGSGGGGGGSGDDGGLGGAAAAPIPDIMSDREGWFRHFDGDGRGLTQEEVVRGLIKTYRLGTDSEQVGHSACYTRVLICRRPRPPSVPPRRPFASHLATFPPCYRPTDHRPSSSPPLSPLPRRCATCATWSPPSGASSCHPAPKAASIGTCSYCLTTASPTPSSPIWTREPSPEIRTSCGGTARWLRPCGRVARPGPHRCQGRGRGAPPAVRRIASSPELPPNIKACPACGMLMEKISGDDKMMCGCEARVAGGTFEKAWAAGGCGHEFNFATLAPLGTGAPGNPHNERQVLFHRH